MTAQAAIGLAAALRAVMKVLREEELTLRVNCERTALERVLDAMASGLEWRWTSLLMALKFLS